MSCLPFPVCLLWSRLTIFATPLAARAPKGRHAPVRFADPETQSSLSPRSNHDLAPLRHDLQKHFRQSVSAAFLGGVRHHQKLVADPGRQKVAGGALRNAKQGFNVPAGDVAPFTEEFERFALAPVEAS
jgi:hypothetical protein